MRKIFLLVISFVLLFSCKKEINPVSDSKDNSAISGRSSKISVCHKTNSASNPWTTIEVNINALQAHLSHGDIIPDEDNDGYTKTNPCGIGSQDDCNDSDSLINPGFSEICNNGKDDNCNGEIDENCYETVTICGITWMLKNLDVSHYKNGEVIPQVQNASDWVQAGLNGIGAWCYYLNNSNNGPIYGKLYNWYAIHDTRGLAPEGWHIASDAEFVSLINCQGGFSIAANNLKETGISHWVNNSFSVTNSSGFTALPGGARAIDGVEYGTLGYTGYWWSSTSTLYIYLSGINSYVGRFTGSRNAGYSVRCIKD